MGKQKPLSLVERAAEIYDFNEALRNAPFKPPVEPAAPDADPVPSPPVEHRARLERAYRPEAPQPEPTRRRPAAPARQREVVPIDRDALARSGVILPEGDGSGLAEEFRIIKRRLLAAIDAAATGDRRARVVLVASPQPGDGKTFFALNLALSIAGEADREVLLVDGDVVKPEVLARLGLEADEGLIDALVDRTLDPEQAVIPTDISGLSLLAAGRREHNLPELLASARTGEVLDRLLEADPRRIILIDSSPVLAASHAGALAEQAGQALVVVRADHTSEADLNEALDMLSACDRISLVLNGAAFRIGGRRFGRYEGYGE